MATFAKCSRRFYRAEFWDRRNIGTKYKTPYEYVISTVRASGLPVRNFRPLAGTMQLLGMPPYGCLTPNGYSNTQDAWLNPDAMMTRLSFATALGTGNLPLEDPPFEEERTTAEWRIRHKRTAVSHNGAGKMNTSFDPGPQAEDDAARSGALAATLGD